MECTCPSCFDCIKDMKCTCCTARPEVQGFSLKSGDLETKQPTSAKAGHVRIPLQEINRYKQQSKAHETLSHPATRTSGDDEITGF